VGECVGELAGEHVGECVGELAGERVREWVHMHVYAQCADTSTKTFMLQIACRELTADSKIKN
jgi:hypothetical protein